MPNTELEKNNADAKKKAEEQAQKKAAELEKNNADASDIDPASAKSVYVFANLPNEQQFRLSSGEDIKIEGMPVSNLVNKQGTSFPGGKHGITVVDADKWAEVERVYGKMKMFTSGLVFSASTIESGKAMARERGGLRHGFEQLDPLDPKLKTKPNEKD